MSQHEKNEAFPGDVFFRRLRRSYRYTSGAASPPRSRRLSIPVGLSQGLPVGLELDALPGNDSELLGLGIAVQAVIGRIPTPSF